MESHDQVRGWDVTVYVIIVWKVAPLCVHTDFLRSTTDPPIRLRPLAADGISLQGLSNIQGADSESVDELLEEGNALEAEVVTGVEEAGGADERGVRTNEVPQDDVPEEYLDKK